MAFARIEELERALKDVSLEVEPIPREALFPGGEAFLNYRKRQGSKTNVLPDFFIGAHAAVRDLAILTRDVGRYRPDFPSVRLLKPT